MKYDVALYWTVTKSCTLDCHQCAGERIKCKEEFAPEKIDIPALRDFLENHKNTCFKINFTGGEPLLVQNLLEAALLISRKNYLSIVSNLVSPRVSEYANQLDPQRVLYFHGSAHIKELERRNLLSRFMENALLLRQKGFQSIITEIAYPFLTATEVQRYFDLFNQNHLDLVFNAFRGTWQGKQYPESYTGEQIKMFKLSKNRIFNHKVNYRRNRFCNAGFNMAGIYENGDAYPCFLLRKKMGNIFTGIDFRETLLRCPFKFCNCPFPVFEQSLFKKALKQTGKHDIHMPYLLKKLFS